MNYEVVIEPDNPTEVLKRFCLCNYVHCGEQTREFMLYLMEMDFEEIDPQWALTELMVD